MADYDLVRLLVGDRKKSVTRELVTRKNDGVELVYQLDMYPLVSGKGNGLGTGTVRIYTSGTELLETATTVWSGGLGRFTFASAITAGAEIRATYSYYALTSGELSELLSGHTGNPYLAAANACLAIVADAARLYSYTMGDKTVNKSRIAGELRELSIELENRHYKMRDRGGFSATQFTFKDNTGTPYYGFDTAVAYLSSSGSG